MMGELQEEGEVSMDMPTEEPTEEPNEEPTEFSELDDDAAMRWLESLAARHSHSEISGNNRTHFCGAYWGYGFHEDGVKSALEVCKGFGKTL